MAAVSDIPVPHSCISANNEHFSLLLKRQISSVDQIIRESGGKPVSRILEWVSLSLIPGLGDMGIRALVDHFGTVSEVLGAGRKKLESETRLKSSVVERLANKDNALKRGEAELARLKQFGGKAVCLDDKQYPELLKQISRPPVVLYTLGNADILSKHCVAIVGSRAATDYGKRCGFNLARDLSFNSVVVVSGMALGIDTEAHRGCLSATGRTAAVLGCGLDVIYPYRNKHLYDQISDRGVLVSEYPLGTKPDGFRFPARNRIIAGLSLGVVVVEAAKKSGSLITAGLALEEGREIFSVPGRIDSFKSAGTHWLLQQGAKLVQGADDIFEEFSPLDSEPSRSAGVSEEQDVPTGDENQRKLLELMDSYPIHRDQLISRSQMSPAQVNELLLYLELEGLIEILVGGEVRKRVR